MYAALIAKLLGQREAPVRAAVIGTGEYATATVTQSMAMPLLDIPAVADLDLDAARAAYRRAGVPEDQISVCETREELLLALERGRRAVTRDALLLMDLPIEIIVEATGVPEAGARHALAAIQALKHVAMVNKEADAAVGPMLKRRADEAGVLYTAVDGDQHGLLMDLVQWARLLGLHVVCAGKARNAEFIYDPLSYTVTHDIDTVNISEDGAAVVGVLRDVDVGDAVRRRGEVLAPLGLAGNYDLVEMAIAANATGLLPDRETLHTPVLRTIEIADVLCTAADGGILDTDGVIELITPLRQEDGPGLGGGEFLVVACDHAYSREMLTAKGLVANRRGTAALIYRPYHLCGVETPMTLLLAGLGGIATGAVEYRPSVDVVVRTRVDIEAGRVLGADHDPRLQALLWPAERVRREQAIPMHLASGNALMRDVPAGTVLTYEMVEPPTDSTLWRLRREQDEVFGGSD